MCVCLSCWLDLVSSPCVYQLSLRIAFMWAEMRMCLHVYVCSLVSSACADSTAETASHSIRRECVLLPYPLQWPPPHPPPPRLLLLPSSSFPSSSSPSSSSSSSPQSYSSSSSSSSSPSSSSSSSSSPPLPPSFLPSSLPGIYWGQKHVSSCDLQQAGLHPSATC